MKFPGLWIILGIVVTMSLALSALDQESFDLVPSTSGYNSDEEGEEVSLFDLQGPGRSLLGHRHHNRHHHRHGHYHHHHHHHHGHHHQHHDHHKQKTCDKFPRVCWQRGSPGKNCCRKKCVNVLTDRRNCGWCGHRCRFSEICCKGKCVNPKWDRKHCGGCNVKCKKGRRCEYGMCSYA